MNLSKEQIQNLWNDNLFLIDMCSKNCDASNYCNRYNKESKNKFKLNVEGGCNHFLLKENNNG